MFQTRAFIWTATRVILGMALPPFVSAQVYFVIAFLTGVVVGIANGSLDLSDLTLSGLVNSIGNFIGYSYSASLAPSIVGSLFMELMGRLIFKTLDNYAKRQRLIYILIGTALGGLVAAYILIPAGDWYAELRWSLSATGLFAGLTMSLLFLQLWKRELKQIESALER